jgi:glyoxylase-like metal-dependent hydrolase (beta-lactamase superfamily II)
MHIGEFEIVPVNDGVGRMNPTEGYSNLSGASIGPPAGYAPRGGSLEDWAPHRDLLDEDGMLTLAFGGFLVRNSERAVLVDTGIGPIDVGTMRGGAFLAELAALGVSPGDVTDVVLTHLHFDHVGWTTQDGEPVFTNATYRCDHRDWEHFMATEAGPVERLSAEKLVPLEHRLEPWEGSGPLLPGIDTMAAPGHTPGSTVLVLSAGIERALLLGDAVHCPVELLDDEWAGMGDVDPGLAQRTRVALARELEGTDIPVVAAHFPGMQFGRLLIAEGKRSWVFDR